MHSVLLKVLSIEAAKSTEETLERGSVRIWTFGDYRFGNLASTYRHTENVRALIDC